MRCRRYTSRPGVSLNLEQQITDTVGVLARAGWVDGNVEPWDFADTDRTVAAGVSISGKIWDRPDDKVGMSGIIDDIASVHAEFFNLGGLGVLVGDGQLPHPGPEKIFEAYYSYALTSSTKLSADYQFIVNPGYNTDRGPVNVFSGRIHWQFQIDVSVSHFDPCRRCRWIDFDECGVTSVAASWRSRRLS